MNTEDDEFRRIEAEAKRRAAQEYDTGFSNGWDKCAERQATQPEHEPVGRFAKFTDNIWREVTDGSAGVPLYTTPPQRQWVGLTDEEVGDLSDFAYANDEEFVRNVEAKLKEKNK